MRTPTSTTQRSEYQPLDSVGPPVASVGSCCKCIIGVLVALLLAVVALGVYVRVISANGPLVQEPCHDTLPLGMCHWAGALLRLTAGGRAQCPRAFGLCTPFDAGVFTLVRIDNDRVGSELAFARNGSELPEGLHGIWWMDQWGSNLPIPGDPDFPYDFPTACDELLITWGDVTWDPQSRCTSPNWQVGGPVGHWTFNDIGDGKSNVWLGPSGRGFISFCFSSDAFDAIDAFVAFLFPAPVRPLLEILGWERVGGGFDGYYWVPTAVVKWTMQKTAWGWARVTTVGNFGGGGDQQKAMDSMPIEIAALLRAPLKTHRYPVFQIVDGMGARTDNYEAYLRWANTDRGENCTCGPTQGCGCGCPINRGNGTSLVGIRSPPPGARRLASAPLPPAAMRGHRA